MVEAYTDGIMFASTEEWSKRRAIIHQQLARRGDGKKTHDQRRGLVCAYCGCPGTEKGRIPYRHHYRGRASNEVGNKIRWICRKCHRAFHHWDDQRIGRLISLRRAG